MFINNDTDIKKNSEEELLDLLTSYTNNKRNFLNDEEG